MGDGRRARRDVAAVRAHRSRRSIRRGSSRPPGTLCKRSYGDPHWEQKPAQVDGQGAGHALRPADREGPHGRLRAVRSRRCAASCSSPTRSSATSTRPRARSWSTTARLLDEVQRLRDKARRSDMLADDYALCALLRPARPRRRLQRQDVRGTGAREAEARDPTVLHLSLADILLDEAARAVARALPRPARRARRDAAARVPVRSRRGRRRHHRHRAARAVAAARSRRAGVDDPGLARGQDPRAARVAAQGAAQDARAARRARARARRVELRPFDGADAARARARDLRAHRRARAARRVGSARAAARTSRFTFRVVDEHDKTLGQGRDLAELQRTLGQRAKELWAARAARAPRAHRPEDVGLRRAAGLGHARRRRPRDARVSRARRRRDRRRRAPARVAGAAAAATRDGPAPAVPAPARHHARQARGAAARHRSRKGRSSSRARR